MSCILYQLKCCFGPYGCSCFCIRPVRISTTTRTMYSIMLIFVTIFMTAVHEKRLLKFIGSQLGNQFNSTCVLLQAHDNCQRLFGFVSVYRIGYAFFFFHILMTLLCICVNTGESLRGKVHNGFWFFKCAFITAIWLLLYFWPTIESYILVATIIGVMAGVLFIVIQHVSIIDVAYETNTYFRTKGTKNFCYDMLLYLLTMLLYLATIAGYAFVYFSFAADELCIRNRVIVFGNAAATAAIVFVSLVVTKHSRHKLYLPAAVMALFVVFITWTAISSAPYQSAPRSFRPTRKDQSLLRVASLSVSKPSTNQTKLYLCRPSWAHLGNTHTGKELHSYLGILLMLLAAVYSSIRSSSDYKRYGIKPARSKLLSQTQLSTITEDLELQAMRKKQNRRSGSHLMRHPSSNFSDSSSNIPLTAIHKTRSMPALNSLGADTTRLTNFEKSSFPSVGVSPKSKLVKKKRKKINEQLQINNSSFSQLTDPLPALCEDTLTNYPIDRFIIHDEAYSVRYSYSWLHFVFSLAYLFVMVQLTNWYSPETSHISNFQQSWPSLWMKLATSWIAMGLFSWTLIFPAFCIGRRLYEFPLDSLMRNHNKVKQPQPSEKKTTKRRVGRRKTKSQSLANIEE